MDKTRFFQQNIVITGGSSGIGLFTAIEFARLDARIFLLARSEAKLVEAARRIRQQTQGDVSVNVFPCDVGSRPDVEKIIHKIGREHGGIHTLINNAGMVVSDLFERLTSEELEQVMRVNYWGAVYALKAAWPYLQKARQGHIGFVASVAGYLGLIGYSAYAPSKFAMTGLAECLRREAADCGIGTTIVFPPDTDTPMLQYEREHTIPESRALSRHARVMRPEEVARQFVHGIQRGKFEVICNRESRMARVVRVLFPRIYFHIVDDIVAKDRRTRG
jgi:3-dehydrosphinganine reductase